MLERTILSQLVHNDEYARRALPYFKREYFESESDQVIFSLISQFYQTYNAAPSLTALNVELDNSRGLNQTLYKECQDKLRDLDAKPVELDWLMKVSEEFCQDRAFYLAIVDSFDIVENKKRDKASARQLIDDALSVNFDSHIGHDYIADADKRYAYYHRQENKVPFDLEDFNKITEGGVSVGTLTVALAGTGVGKTLFMTHFAASALLQGYDVLYITLEMSEERIAERIDANLLNIPIKDLKHTSEEIYKKRINALIKRAAGKLIIKEYPMSSAHVGHFRHLLNELRLKKKFIPKVIVVDYLGICASARVSRIGEGVNSYQIIKYVAEELRGLAQEFDVPVITATQVNRTGFGSTDVDLTDTSESFGIPMTADMMFALIRTEELDQLGQLMVKQLKNRYQDEALHRKFMIGVDRSRMRLFNLEDSTSGVGKDSLPSVSDQLKGRKAKLRSLQV